MVTTYGYTEEKLYFYKINGEEGVYSAQRDLDTGATAVYHTCNVKRGK